MSRIEYERGIRRLRNQSKSTRTTPSIANGPVTPQLGGSQASSNFQQPRGYASRPNNVLPSATRTKTGMKNQGYWSDRQVEQGGNVIKKEMMRNEWRPRSPR